MAILAKRLSDFFARIFKDIYFALLIVDFVVVRWKIIIFVRHYN